MLLNSNTYTVCKFQKYWIKNKKNAYFGDCPLKKRVLHSTMLIIFFWKVWFWELSCCFTCIRLNIKKNYHKKINIKDVHMYEVCLRQFSPIYKNKPFNVPQNKFITLSHWFSRKKLWATAIYGFFRRYFPHSRWTDASASLYQSRVQCTRSEYNFWLAYSFKYRKHMYV